VGIAHLTSNSLAGIMDLQYFFNLLVALCVVPGAIHVTFFCDRSYARSFRILNLLFATIYGFMTSFCIPKVSLDRPFIFPDWVCALSLFSYTSTFILVFIYFNTNSKDTKLKSGKVPVSNANPFDKRDSTHRKQNKFGMLFSIAGIITFICLGSIGKILDYIIDKNYSPTPISAQIFIVDEDTNSIANAEVNIGSRKSAYEIGPYFSLNKITDNNGSVELLENEEYEFKQANQSRWAELNIKKDGYRPIATMIRQDEVFSISKHVRHMFFLEKFSPKYPFNCKLIYPHKIRIISGRKHQYRNNILQDLRDAGFKTEYREDDQIFPSQFHHATIRFSGEKDFIVAKCVQKILTSGKSSPPVHLEQLINVTEKYPHGVIEVLTNL
jgi:hypothetical protein